MLPYINEKNVGGYCYKNITIECERNRNVYNIATQYNLGLPPETILCGISYRLFTQERIPVAFSVNARPLLSSVYLQQGFITLRDIETIDVLSSQPLYSNITENETGTTIQTGVIWHEPRKIGEIDWQRSIISFPNWLFPDDFDLEDFDIELQVIYYNPEESCKILPQLTDRTGFAQEGTRSKMVEIIQRAGVQYYSISKNSTIGIDKEAIIVGIGLNYYTKVSSTYATKPAGLDCTFLTIKDRYRTIVNNLPVSLGQSENNVSLQKNIQKYLPIQPTKCSDFDWEGSQLFTSVSSLTSDEGSGLLQIFYVQPIYK
jgi:hypothetical protein